MDHNQLNPTDDEKVVSRPLLSRLAWLPIPVFLVAIAALWVAGVRVAWPQPILYWFVHYGSVVLGVTCIVIPAARSVLANGEPSVLMLGCGVLMMDIGVTAMPIAMTRSPDRGFAIYNTSILLAALCQFAGVALTARGKVRLRRSGRWLTAAYVGGAAAMGLVIWGALAGRLPVFFIDGQGGTVVRSLVVGTSVVLFLLTASLLWQTHRRTPSPFFYWYALGLALLAAGLAGSMMITVKDSPLQWVARFTQFFGGVYMCVAVLASARAKRKGIALAALEDAWREPAFLADFRQHMPFGWGLRYSVAVAAVVAAMGLRQALTAWAGLGLPPYITFYPTVMVVAVMGGFGPGLVATALAGVAAAYWILPSTGQFTFASPVDRLGLVIFTGMGLFVSMVAHLYRRHRHKAAAYDREAVLRESQARLAAFAAATFEGIVESDAGRILDCNEQYSRMVGYSVAELRGVEIASLIAPEDRDRVMAVIREGGESRTEHAMLRKDGTQFIVEVHGQPVSPGGARRHTAIRDITDQKRAEEALRDSRAKLEAALASMTDAVFISDAQGRFIEFNDAFATFHRFKTKDECAKTLAEYPGILEVSMADGELAPLDQWAVPRALRGERVTNAEYTLRRKDTGETWVGSYSFGPIRDKDGAIVGSVVAGRDITDLKRAETEIRRRADELHAANEELVRFNRVTVGRELRIIELKKQVNDLCARLGQPPRYKPEPDEKAEPTP